MTKSYLFVQLRWPLKIQSIKHFDCVVRIIIVLTLKYPDGKIMTESLLNQWKIRCVPKLGNMPL